MPNSSQQRKVAGAAVAAILAATVPYLLAINLAPAGFEFGGFLVNPLDGFSYLAKMRQGAGGSWLFRLPYAANPGAPAFLFSFYLTLGHVASWLGAELLAVFHVARILFGAIMLFAAHRFLQRITEGGPALTLGFVLFALGSGLGWLAGPLGLITLDLTVPEAIPFFSMLVNPHFPLAVALLAGYGLVLLAGESNLRRQLPAAAAIGAGLALVQPFAVLTPVLVTGAWLVWEAGRDRRDSWRSLWGRLRDPVLRWLSFGLGAAPWLLYDLWLVRTQPALAVWNAQNQTPSPSLPATLLGLGVVGGLAVVGSLLPRSRSTRAGRLMIVWLLVNLALLYAPLSLQRRLALGLFLPMAALAGFALEWILATRARGKATVVLLLALALPSNVLVALAGLAQVAAGDPTLLLAHGERETYQWIDENAPAASLVLAAPRSGNRLPAFADVRVLYGHPFETPHAERQRNLVTDLYQSGSLQELQALDLDLALYGPAERELAQPSWLTRIKPAVEVGAVTVFAIPSR